MSNKKDNLIGDAVETKKAVESMSTGTGNVGEAVATGLDAAGIGDVQAGDVADAVLPEGVAEDEKELLHDSRLTTSDVARTAGAAASLYAGDVRPENVQTVVSTAKQAAPAAKKYAKKKLGKTIRRWLLFTLIPTLIALLLIMALVLPPIIAAITVVLDEMNKPDTGPVQYDANGNIIEPGNLCGGIGVDYAALIAEYQAMYDAATTDEERYDAAGKIAYTQIFQFLDAESLETAHPMVLLGTATLIKETSTINSQPQYWAKNKIAGDLRGGIYTTYFTQCLNGVPGAGSGGSILSDNGTRNLGAKGPLQLECNHYVLYTKNADGSITVNTDVAASRVDDSIAQQDNYMPYVGPEKGHIQNLIKNPTFTTLILTDVGHPSFMSEYRDYSLTVDCFKKENGYLFPDRFTDSNKLQQDFAMSLECIPSALLVTATYNIGSYPLEYTDELASIFDSVSQRSLLDQEVAAYGYNEESTFRGRVAYEVYWTLLALQRWNAGSNGFQWGADTDRRKLDRLFVEISNFVATNGMEALYNQCSDITGYSIYNSTHFGGLKDSYTKLINYVCQTNGTDPTELLAVINSFSSSKNFVHTQYAISGLFNAYYYCKVQAADVLRLENFDVTNYGGTKKSDTLGASGATGLAGQYNSSVSGSWDPIKHPINTQLPCGVTGEQVIYYYTPNGSKQYWPSENLCAMFEGGKSYKITCQFSENQFHSYPHGGCDSICTAGAWMTYTIADCEVIWIKRCNTGGYNNDYYLYDVNGNRINHYSYKPSGWISQGTSIRYAVLDANGNRTGLEVIQMHLRPGSLDDLSVGDKLPMGFGLGYACSTGSSTGTHSHTEFHLMNCALSFKPQGDMRCNAEPFIIDRLKNVTRGGGSGSIMPTFESEKSAQW